MKRNQKVTDSLISERYFFGVSPDARKHLLSSLSNLRDGAPTTPSFRLYGKSDWSVVTDFLESVGSLSDVPPWLLEYEYSRKEKFGPQGGHAPWDDLRENALLYFSRPQEVRATVRRCEHYRSLRVQKMSAKDTLLTLRYDGRIMNRAAGWRCFDLKKTDPLAQRMALEDIHSGNWVNGWAYFFSRFNKQKKRLFIPMPFSSMILQAQYYHPFLTAIQEDLLWKGPKSQFIFWSDKLGFDFCFHHVLEPMLQNVDPNHIVYVMRDFDKMDTSTGPKQKSAFFLPKLAKAFNYSENSENFRIMKDIILFSNICPIATPDGMMTGAHGEASGATVTNGGETCCNESYNDEFQDLLEKSVSKDLYYREIISLGNGDDGITLYELGDVSRFDEFASAIRKAADGAAENCGFVIQAEKWDIHLGTYGKYCQYLVDWNGSLLRAMYPASLILNSIVNPEKRYSKATWDKDYRDIDIIMKLSNGRELPYFSQLIDYVDNGMKYRLLGNSEESTKRILSKYDSYRALQDGSLEFNKWYYKEEHGLASNPVVQYLLKKRNHNI